VLLKIFSLKIVNFKSSTTAGFQLSRRCLSKDHPIIATTAAPAKQVPAYTITELYCPLATANPVFGGPDDCFMVSRACCRAVEIGVDRMLPTPRPTKRKLKIVVANDGSSSSHAGE
jgi:hypothetical protein